MPGSSPLSMRLGTWSGWAGKKRKNANCKKKRTMPGSEGCGRKTRKESADALTLKNTPCRAPTDRRCHPSPPHHPASPSLLPPSHINEGEDGDLGSHTSSQSSWSNKSNLRFFRNNLVQVLILHYLRRFLLISWHFFSCNVTHLSLEIHFHL